MSKNIRSVGDSHSLFSFKGVTVSFESKDGKESIPVINHHLGAITMHRVGRDQLSILDFRKFAQEGDTIITCFGEIDIRCHVKKQLQERKLDEVIDTLARKYINTLTMNRQLVSCKIIVMSVVPPLTIAANYRAHNKDYPVVGSDEERSGYTILLNKRLQELCLEYNILYLDVYQHYCDKNGLLIESLSDNNVHIGKPDFVQTELRKLLNQ